MTMTGKKEKLVFSDVEGKIRDVLQNFALERRINITSCKVEKKRTNTFLSDVRRCILEGKITENNEIKDYQAGFIVKELPLDKQYVRIYNCDVAFRNESTAYKNILPILKKYCPRGLPIPESVYVSPNLILLEDLTDKGFGHFDKLTGYNVELVKLILKELANLHAGSLILRHGDEIAYKKILDQVEEVLIRSDVERNWFEVLYERCIDTTILLINSIKQEDPERNKKLLQIVNGFKGNTCATMQNSVARKGLFDVINHGDMWASNMLVNGSELKLIDFQIMRHTSPAADLSYFFNVNLDPDFHKEHREEFLQFYHQELTQNIKDLPFKDDITFDWLKNEMSVFAQFGFLSGLWVMPVFYYTLNTINKTADEFLKQLEIPAEEIFANMTTDHKDRMKRLIYSYMSDANVEGDDFRK